MIHHSDIKRIEVSKNADITGYKDVKVNQIDLFDDVEEVNLNLDNYNYDLNINVANPLKVTSKDRINKISINNAKDVLLEVPRIDSLTLGSNKSTFIELNNTTRIGNLVIPEGAKLEQVLKIMKK